AATSAVHFAAAGPRASAEAARRISALTHGDPAAWEGTVILHELVRLALAGADPLDVVADALAATVPDHRQRYTDVLAADWHPDQATAPNGAVWPCLGSAVWALRTTDSFELALRAAVDLGGDTDTVAAVTGALAGARYGLGAIPDTWTAPLHVPLPGFDRTLRPPDLLDLTRQLLTTP
ncbi:MAG: ADP-ribosylglycohydrolase family protein, partial [Micromonosporaceae bacterium]